MNKKRRARAGYSVRAFAADLSWWNAAKPKMTAELVLHEAITALWIKSDTALPPRAAVNALWDPKASIPEVQNLFAQAMLPIFPSKDDVATAQAHLIQFAQKLCAAQTQDEADELLGADVALQRSVPSGIENLTFVEGAVVAINRCQFGPVNCKSLQDPTQAYLDLWRGFKVSYPEFFKRLDLPDFEVNACE